MNILPGDWNRSFLALGDVRERSITISKIPYQATDSAVYRAELSIELDVHELVF